MNGRISGDLSGRYTCYKPNRASIVDYAIASNGLMKYVTYFSVLPFNFYLCHCPVAFAPKTKTFSVDNNYIDFYNLNQIILFGVQKRSLYTSLLNEEPVLSESKTILNEMTQDKLSYECIDTAVDSITEVLYKTATNCFTLNKHRIKKRKNKPQKKMV